MKLPIEFDDVWDRLRDEHKVEVFRYALNILLEAYNSATPEPKVHRTPHSRRGQPIEYNGEILPSIAKACEAAEIKQSDVFNYRKEHNVTTQRAFDAVVARSEPEPIPRLTKEDIPPVEMTVGGHRMGDDRH